MNCAASGEISRRDTLFTTVLLTIIISAFPQSAVPGEEAKGKKKPRPKPQCAHVCVYKACRLMGVTVEMDKVMARIPFQEEGNSLTEIRDAFAWIGIESKGFRLDYKELVKGPFPMIAHFPDHFVVVLEEHRKQMVQVPGVASDEKMQRFRRWPRHVSAIIYLRPKEGAYRRRTMQRLHLCFCSAQSEELLHRMQSTRLRRAI